MHNAFDLAKRLGAKSAPLVPTLVGIMETNSNYFGLAAEVINLVGPEGKQAIPVLQLKLKDKNQSSHEMAHVFPALANLGVPEHAQAARVLPPFMPRSEESMLLRHYFPHYPNDSVVELRKLLDEPKLRPNVLKTLNRLGERDDHQSNISTEVLKNNETDEGRSPDRPRGFARRQGSAHDRRAAAYSPFAFEAPDGQGLNLIRVCLTENTNNLYSVPIFMALKTTIPVFIEEAAKQDDYSRYYNVFSSANPAAIPVLIKIAKTESPRQCVQAAWGLAGMSYTKMPDELRAEAIATLLARLPDLKSPQRGEVGMAILSINAKAPPPEAIVAVGEYLIDPNVKSPGNAAFLLQQFGKKAAPATEHFRRALTHTNAHVRLQAAATLVTIDKNYADEVLPLVQKAIDERAKEDTKSPNGNVGIALHICSVLGADARSMLPRVLEINRTENEYAAILAGKAAVAMDKDCIPEVARNLAALLGRTSCASLSVDEHPSPVARWGQSRGGADEHLVTLMRRPRILRYDVAITLIMMQGPNADKGIEHVPRSTRKWRRLRLRRGALISQFSSRWEKSSCRAAQLLDTANEHDRARTPCAHRRWSGRKGLLPDLRRRLERTARPLTANAGRCHRENQWGNRRLSIRPRFYRGDRRSPVLISQASRPHDEQIVAYDSIVWNLDWSFTHDWNRIHGNPDSALGMPLH